jgi:hypothetical protein
LATAASCRELFCISNARIALAIRIDYFQSMSLAEIKTAVDQLSARELAELAAFIRERDNTAWDREIDEDFAETGRLHRVLEEVSDDTRAGRLQDLP